MSNPLLASFFTAALNIEKGDISVQASSKTKFSSGKLRGESSQHDAVL
jgi:hypothetical protein